MATRRARRRSPAPQAPLLTRFLQWITGWEGIIALSIVLVLVVLIQGILRLPLPFSLGEPEPPADAWGYIKVPRGTSPKIVYIGNVATGVSVDAAGAKQAVQFALKERGTFKGTTVELQVVEDLCDPAAATTKAQELLQDPAVVGVISQACSPSTLATKSTFDEGHLVYLSLTEGSPSFTAGAPQALFRLQGNETLQGNTAALYARQDLQAEKAIILHEDTPDMLAVAEAFRTQFRPQGGRILDMRVLPADRGAWQGILDEVQDLGADLVYMAGRGKISGNLVGALRSNGFQGAYIVTDAAYEDPEYLLAGPVIEGSYATTLQTPRLEKYAFWKVDFEKEFLAVGPYSAEAYDAASTLLQSLELAGRVGRDGTLEVGRQLLVGLIRSLPFEGVTGRAAFDANGDRANVLVPVMKFENGNFHQVK